MLHLSGALDAARAVRPELVGELLERLGTAQLRAGRTVEAEATWRAALAARPAPGPTARLHGLIATVIWDQGRFDAASAEVDAGFAALADLPPDAPERTELRLLRIRLVGRLAHLGDLEAEVEALLDQVDDPAAAAALHLAQADAAFIRGDLPTAIGLTGQAMRAARAADRPVTEAHAHRMAFIASLALGHIEVAREHTRLDLAAAERSGVPTVQASPRMCLMLLALSTDDWDGGLRIADSLIAFGHRIGAARALAAAFSCQGTILAMRGRLDEASALVAESRAVFGRGSAADRHIFVTIEMAEAIVALHRGDAARAHALATSASTIPGQLPCLTFDVVARSALALGDVDGAAETVRRLRAIGPGPWPEATADWLSGLVALATDGPEAGAPLLDRAASGLAALGMPVQAARARLEWAACVGSAPAASGALRVFERLDARPLADRARQVLRGLGVRPARSQTSAAELSARELEVVALVAAGLSNPEIAQRLFISPRTVTTRCEVHFLLHGAIAPMLGELAFACRDLLGWSDAQSFELLGGLSAVSTRPAHRLAALARTAGPEVRALLAEDASLDRIRAVDQAFADGFDAYVREFGHRALRYEIAEPTLAESPRLILRLLADQVDRGYDPDAEIAALARRRAEVAASARAALSGTDLDRFERALARATRAYPVREDNEFVTFSAPLALLRYVVVETGRRLAARGLLASPEDVFFLRLPEARDAAPGLADLVARRRGERAWIEQHPGPASYGAKPGPPPSFAALPPEARFNMEVLLWVVERIFESERSALPQAPGAGVTGIAASPGRYTGPVRVVRDESEFGKLRAGDVLVCPVTSPVWSVLFPTVGALVTVSGGLLSHPAIIAREYRVPAVVATGNATELLRDGQIVTVDGAAGVVEVTP